MDETRESGEDAVCHSSVRGGVHETTLSRLRGVMDHIFNQEDPDGGDHDERAVPADDDAVVGGGPASSGAQLRRASRRVLDEFADQAREILAADDDSRSLGSASIRDLEDCFNEYDQHLTGIDARQEFETIQAFILEEQKLGRKRRRTARTVEASEEKRLASDVAELKAFRLRSQDARAKGELREKVADAERSYMSRKMVVVKASQVANAECRLQFRRVRAFFGGLHNTRSDSLRRQYERSLKIQGLTHRLRNTDPRVAALERQIVNRLYQKKVADLNELHMVENTEEAAYMESMLDLLFEVQLGKEAAAREMFEVRVRHLKHQCEHDSRREGELAEMRASAVIEMAKVVDHYTSEEDENTELEEQVRENVDSMERLKDFDASLPILTVSQLYDVVLWSAVMSEATATSLCSSDFDSEEGNICGEDDADIFKQARQEEPTSAVTDADTVSDWRKEGTEIPSSDAASTQPSARDGSVNSGRGSEDSRQRVSLPGRMHIKQLSKELQAKEKALHLSHDMERKQERRRYQSEITALKLKHQRLVEGLIHKCLIERHNLRDAICTRMQALEHSQGESTKALRRVIARDVSEMEEALRHEAKRVEEAEMTSFVKAQELISSQVFHEVRNALSSVIAMSEMTASLKSDASLRPQDLVSSVDSMLDQVNEIVKYSLTMLNNVLDISKIKTGSVSVESKPVDLQELVAGATRMQLAKTGKVLMTFTPRPEPLIGNTNADIVTRIITNFISNAIKFTSAGAIQPFACPIEVLFPRGDFDPGTEMSRLAPASDTAEHERYVFQPLGIGVQYETSSMSSKGIDEPPSDSGSTRAVRQSTSSTSLIAVGVADTGPGLRRETLQLSESQISSTEDPDQEMRLSVRNTGFGLHLAHILATALGSKLHLTSLENCLGLLNDQMLRAVDEYRESLSTAQSQFAAFCSGSTESSSSSCTLAAPGPGTVLFFTVQAASNDDAGDDGGSTPLLAGSSVSATDTNPALSRAENVEEGSRSAADIFPHPEYAFSPRPSPSSEDGTFRILVADDVRILRKGLVHTVSEVFRDVPVSVATACTAEEVLRALADDPYDLVVCDNQFLHEPLSLPALAVVDGREERRPRLLHDPTTVSAWSPSSATPASHGAPPGEVAALHRRAKDFFEAERFSLREGDGALSGYDALRRVAPASASAYVGLSSESITGWIEAEPLALPYPAPILVLLSGQRFGAPPRDGVIVAQKPLAKSAFVALLEEHAADLLRSGYCMEASGAGEEHGNSGGCIVNRHGSQLFVSREPGAAASSASRLQ